MSWMEGSFWANKPKHDINKRVRNDIFMQLNLIVSQDNSNQAHIVTMTKIVSKWMQGGHEVVAKDKTVLIITFIV